MTEIVIFCIIMGAMLLISLLITYFLEIYLPSKHNKKQHAKLEQDYHDTFPFDSRGLEAITLVETHLSPSLPSLSIREARERIDKRHNLALNLLKNNDHRFVSCPVCSNLISIKSYPRKFCVCEDTSFIQNLHYLSRRH